VQAAWIGATGFLPPPPGVSCGAHRSVPLQVDINSLKKTALAELYPLRKERKGAGAEKLETKDSPKRGPLTLAEV
jgi:hypothetical protein